MKKNTLSIEDKVHIQKGASVPKAVARYIFHPSIQIKKISQDQWELLLPNQKVIQLRVVAGEGHIEGSRYAPEFGKTQTTQCLAVKLVGTEAPHSQVEIHWA
jgi:uncharacterized heparinase superfamily protein